MEFGFESCVGTLTKQSDRKPLQPVLLSRDSPSSREGEAGCSVFLSHRLLQFVLFCS